MLTIAIPTYNRSEMLAKWLSEHRYLEFFADVSIKIYDNNSSDETRDVVRQYSELFSRLSIVSSHYTVKAEVNFENAIKGTIDNWVWLIGDSYKIPKANFKSLKDALSDNFSHSDVVIVNVAGRVCAKNYLNLSLKNVASDICGAASCVGSTIYNRSRNKDVEFLDKHISNFCPVSYILDRINCPNSTVSWLGSCSIFPIPSDRKNWSHSDQVFEIAIDGWFDAVSRYFIDLPDCNYRAAGAAFGRVSGLFRLPGLIRLRSQGLLRSSQLSKRASKARFCLGRSYPLAVVISIVPVGVAKFAFGILKMLLK